MVIERLPRSVEEWKQYDVVILLDVDPNKITFSVIQGFDGQTRNCTALSSGKCANRQAGTELRMRLSYDASTLIFLPSTFRLGAWLNVKIPTSLPPYDYSIMVEQH